jgi:hypothetical protein
MGVRTRVDRALIQGRQMSKAKQQPSGGSQNQANRDNHAKNLNPNNDNSWKSRGYPE